MKNPDDPTMWLAGVHVLVADDCEAECEMLVHTLSLYGATVTATTSVRSALATVRAERPDVLVSDITFEDGDGYSLARELRAMPPTDGGQTPAVAVTGWATEADRAAAIDAGFHVHLAKPVPLETLVAVIATLARHGRASAVLGTDDDSANRFVPRGESASGS